ncbi:MAG: hypothetical protein QOG84_600 [Sphingomonadales bacterium]|jgi:hypothetical protein|nr:hypothetical protein [Sphingomonadales bacterium]
MGLFDVVFEDRPSYQFFHFNLEIGSIAMMEKAGRPEPISIGKKLGSQEFIEPLPPRVGLVVCGRLKRLPFPEAECTRRFNVTFWAPFRPAKNVSFNYAKPSLYPSAKRDRRHWSAAVANDRRINM